MLDSTVVLMELRVNSILLGRQNMLNAIQKMLNRIPSAEECDL